VQFIFEEGAVSKEAKRVKGVYIELRRCSSKNVSRNENCFQERGKSKISDERMRKRKTAKNQLGGEENVSKKDRRVRENSKTIRKVELCLKNKSGLEKLGEIEKKVELQNLWVFERNYMQKRNSKKKKDRVKCRGALAIVR
jgi:hypothetical protein